MTALSVVSSNGQTVADRIAALQAESRDLGAAHIGRMCALLEELETLCRQAVTFGDAIPVGARERADRVAHLASAFRDDLTLFSARAKR
jgi:hypothetical protein